MVLCFAAIQLPCSYLCCLLQIHMSCSLLQQCNSLNGAALVLPLTQLLLWLAITLSQTCYRADNAHLS